MAGRRRYIDAPPQPDHGVNEDDQLLYRFSNNAALVCTNGHEEGHSNCHDDCPLSVLFVVTPYWEWQGETVVYLYSSEQGLWNEVASGDFSPLLITQRPVVLLQNNVLYWTMALPSGMIQNSILAFELDSQRLYLIRQPAFIFDAEHAHVQVMEAEDGRLGVVAACGLSLQLWVLHGYDGNDRELWVINRETFLYAELAPPEPIFDDYYLIWILGVDDNVVLVRTEAGIIEVDLQADKSKRLCHGYGIQALYPYRSFYRQGIPSLIYIYH